MKIIRLGRHHLDIHSEIDRKRMSPAALQAFFQLITDWGVPDSDARTLLGRMTLEEYALLRTNPRTRPLEPSELKRVACLLSIWYELSQVYGPSLAGEWAQLPNKHPMFCNVTPIMYMLIGGVQAMANVQRLLIKQRRAAEEAEASDQTSS
jgi:hypothetical protein